MCCAKYSRSSANPITLLSNKDPASNQTTRTLSEHFSQKTISISDDTGATNIKCVSLRAERMLHNVYP